MRAANKSVCGIGRMPPYTKRMPVRRSRAGCQKCFRALFDSAVDRVLGVVKFLVLDFADRNSGFQIIDGDLQPAAISFV